MKIAKEALDKIAQLKAEIEAKKSYDPSEEVVEVIRPEETSVVVSDTE